MNKNIHQIRKCLKPNCNFRFHNQLNSEQLIYCPKCGSPTEVIETPYASMLGNDGRVFDGPPIEVLLDNIRSAYNVGSIIRSSDGIGISHIHFCGITPTPDHPKVVKTSLGAENNIPWTQHWNSTEAAELLSKQGYHLVALEGGEKTTSILDFIKSPPNAPLVLVMGNEVSGVDPGLLEVCHHRIWLPMLGEKNSFNVSVAYGIAAYILRFFRSTSN